MATNTPKSSFRPSKATLRKKMHRGKRAKSEPASTGQLEGVMTVETLKSGQRINVINKPLDLVARTPKTARGSNPPAPLTVTLKNMQGKPVKATVTAGELPQEDPILALQREMRGKSLEPFDYPR